MDFKKALIATSAICVVAALDTVPANAASKPKLTISGYYEMFGGVATGDRVGSTVDGTPVYKGDTTVTEGTFSVVHYGEIRFRVDGKTDSGMNWGVYFEDVQDDADISGNKGATDEAHIELSGSWGKVELGGQDGPADRLYAGAQRLAHVPPEILDVFAATWSIEGGRGFAREKMNINDSSDDSKITYYTPRVSGLQAGYSWVPQTSAKGSVGAASSGSSAHEFGVEYNIKINSGHLQATWSGSIMDGDLPDDGFAAKDANFGWRTGITYSQGPWTLAAGYKDAGRWARFDESGDHTGWDVGVAYSGGSWEVALLHIRTKTKDNEGDLIWDHSMLTGAYNLGGGLTGSLSLTLFDLNQPTEAADHGNSGQAVIVGLGAKF